ETFPTPCHQDLDAGRLSATIDSLWLRCATGTAATVYVSTDAGASWSDVPTGEPAVPSSGSAVGARDASRAVVAARGEARSIGADGTTKARVPGLGSPSFAGFTTDQVGYILDLQGRLFRTDDGGASWSHVSIR
ncbi:MAG: WD40/YVTN/BNR-like repeat-containing protein, partial [Actinopolymorphaceae bacterium]